MRKGVNGSKTRLRRNWPFLPQRVGRDAHRLSMGANNCSESPGQGNVPVEIPLIRSMWLAKRSGRNRLLKWSLDAAGQPRTVECRVEYADGSVRRVLRPAIEITEQPSRGSSGKGTSTGGAATCPISGYTTPVENVRKQLESRCGGARDARLLCVVLTKRGENGRIYRIAGKNDQRVYDASAKALHALILRKETTIRFSLREGSIICVVSLMWFFME